MRFRPTTLDTYSPETAVTLEEESGIPVVPLAAHEIDPRVADPGAEAALRLERSAEDIAPAVRCVPVPNGVVALPSFLVLSPDRVDGGKPGSSAQRRG